MPPETLAGRLRASLASSWRSQARPEQLPPPGDWSDWLVLAGRGWGKTRTGSEFIHETVANGTARRIALVAATAGDVREVMVEGQSGILATAPAHARPEYEPSKRRLTWPCGAVATTYSADEPDRLRGPEHDTGWCDEVAAWNYGQAAVDMLRFGLRVGKRPRCLWTTTPKPVATVIDLVRREGPNVVITRGRTLDNAVNLAPSFIEQITKRYGGTRLGRQELEGELLQDVPGALWRQDWIDADRVERAPDLTRIVVAIDPAVSNNEGSDLTGIIVAGRAQDGHFYVLDDLSGRYGPAEWAAKAISAFRFHKADRIVAEVNNGGGMVESTLRNVDASIPFKAVTASRGKVTRAEPVSALYEKHMVHHVGGVDGNGRHVLADLETQMTAFTSDFDRGRAGYSPDRVDALVWALTTIADFPKPLVITKAMLDRAATPTPGSPAWQRMHAYSPRRY